MHRVTSPLRAAVASSLLVGAVLLTSSFLLGVSPAGAQSGDDTPQTTSTLPVDNRQLGDMIPKPNTGMEPQSAGDPGGWLQVSLFFLICAAIIIIATAIWWTSRRARERRSAAGMDPVSLAKARGEGLRPGASRTSTSRDAT
jgi:hypothetical protein